MYLDMKQCIQWLNHRVQEASVRLNHWILDTMLWRYCIILFARLVTNLFKDARADLNMWLQGAGTHVFTNI